MQPVYQYGQLILARHKIIIIIIINSNLLVRRVRMYSPVTALRPYQVTEPTLPDSASIELS